MDRMEEYGGLMEELGREPEELSGAVGRAEKRARRARAGRCAGAAAAGLISLAACFALLVNICTPIALACGRVPILRDLAQAVIVSQSLSAAVANECVQLVGQERTADGCTIRLEYVIADRKQVNVFFTVEGEALMGQDISAVVDVATEGAPPCTIIGGLCEPGELEYASINFVEGNTPEHLDLTVTVESAAGEREELAGGSFSLDLDPYLLTLGRTVEIDQDFALDGNEFTLTTVELYPTHMRLNIEQAPDNADWLVSLELTIDGDGREVKRVDSKGLVSTGGRKYGDLSLYTASPWYYGCGNLELTITEGLWLDKEREETVIDLETGEAAGLPEGVEFAGLAKDWKDAGTALCFRWESGGPGLPFGSQFRDGEGAVYDSTHIYAQTAGASGVMEASYGLGDFQGEKVVLENTFSHWFVLDEPITVSFPVR